MRDLVLAAVSRAPSLVDQIYAILRQELRAGGFQAGQRLVDSSLARAMSVSRTPVREALSRLVADGLLETGDSGFQIPVPTVAAMEEIFDIRRLIEPPAAARAAASLDDAGREELAAAVEAARRAESDAVPTAFQKANYQFRAAWVARIGNPRLRDTILRFDDQAGAVRRATLALPAARRDALALLERWLDAFSCADSDAAASSALAFIDTAARHFREIAEDVPAAAHAESKRLPGHRPTFDGFHAAPMN